MNSKFLLLLDKPEYFFKPIQIIKRLRHSAISTEFETVRLPWGLDIRIRPNDDIGGEISCKGLYDLVLSEAIWRLLEPGERAVDVGANIGYISSLMAARVGKSGNVTAFEAHPLIFEELQYNIQIWKNAFNAALVDAHQIGVSNKSGTGHIGSTDYFKRNRGTASLLSEGSSLLENGSLADESSIYEISLVPLNDFFSDDVFISLMKIDVEGHEISVLEGASKLIEEKRVRDIIFEDYGKYPSAVMSLLEKKGYSLFSLGRSFFGPKLFAPDKNNTIKPWEPPSYLATTDPERAKARLKSIGWSVIR